MADGKKIVNILKWVGIVALVSLPIVILIKKRRDMGSGSGEPDDADYFSGEGVG